MDINSCTFISYRNTKESQASDITYSFSFKYENAKVYLNRNVFIVETTIKGITESFFFLTTQHHLQFNISLVTIFLHFTELPPTTAASTTKQVTTESSSTVELTTNVTITVNSASTTPTTGGSGGNIGKTCKELVY